MSYITHTRTGSYCDVCGSILGQEEIDFECCDCCGGEGFGEDEDEDVSDESADDLIDYYFGPSKAASPPQEGKP